MQMARLRALEFGWESSRTTDTNTLAHCLSIPPNRTHPEALKWNHQCAGQSIKQRLDWHLLSSGFVKQAVRTLRFWLQDFAGLQQFQRWSPSPVPVPNICPHAVPMQQRLSSVNIPVTGGRYSSSHPTCGKCPLVMKSSRAGCTWLKWSAVPILGGDSPLSGENTICLRVVWLSHSGVSKLCY